MEKLFEYECNQVEGSALDMIVRSASADNEIHLNRKLIVYILHKGEIWYWMKGIDL